MESQPTPSLSRPYTRALACVLWVLGLRFLFIVHTGQAAQVHWALLADLALVALVFLLLPGVRTLPRVGVAAALTTLVYYAAGQHVRTHGTLFRLAHASMITDGDFLAGSVMTSDTAYALPYLLWTGVGLAWLSRPYRRGDLPVRVGPRRAAAALTLVVAYVVATPNITHPSNNVVVVSLIQVPDTIWRSIPRESEPRPMAGERRTEPNFFLTERAPVVPPSRPNVLVIVAEALSGAYLPSVARIHGVEPELQIPALDRTLDRHRFRVYHNMINMQRQTDRGTYPLVCGDYPRTVTSVPKMSTVAELDRPLRCLPALLSEAGYSTLYYQAAYLRFMRKDAFMRLAGFDRVVGREELAERGVEGGGWGPSDPSFYAAAANELIRMSEQRAPWHAMLLNVGTHHPYAEGNEEDEPFVTSTQERRQRAFEILAESLGELLDALETSGVLDDTLVFIVSDESGGVRLDTGDYHPLGSNWGMLAVRTPANDGPTPLAPTARIVAQIDVPLTILDLLGLDAPTEMIGRSLTVDEPLRSRDLLFGDTYSARTYFLHEGGELVGCGETTLGCEHWTFEPERLFGSLRLSDRSPRLTLSERLGLVADASIIRHLGAHEGEGFRHAPLALQAGKPRSIALPAEILERGHLDVELRLRQFDDAASGGRFTLAIDDPGDGRRIAQSTIVLRPGATAPHRVRLIAPLGSSPADPLDLTLHWKSANDTSPIAVLELSTQPASD